MTKKVTLPRDVAEAIEELRESGRSNIDIIVNACEPVVNGTLMKIKRWAFCEGGGSENELLSALLNGYEVEQPPEEKLVATYKDFKGRCDSKLDYTSGLTDGCVIGIETTLAILGIKIEGINA